MSAHSDILAMNRHCACYPISRSSVEAAIIEQQAHPEMNAMLASRENYFASTSVFVSDEVVADMKAQIAAIEYAIESPVFKSHIAGRAGEVKVVKTKGAFMGYDFHITEDGPRLIEINSNAGGAFIVAAIRQAAGLPGAQVETDIRAMFVREWQLSGRSGEPKHIAIIDDDPNEQFHYPDMCLAAAMFWRFGWQTDIVDPSEVEYDNGQLRARGKIIDLVYNRLTDFDLSAPDHQALKQAWAEKAVVVTPEPCHHALHADKRNLITLTDPNFIAQINVSAQNKLQLEKIPKTVAVGPDNVDQLWQDRRNYFFKPFAGFGSRAVYRGAKLTKSKWQEISAGGYVAQALVAPPQRLVTHETISAPQKFDVRVYTYDGKPFLMAARIYQGQVTNLRTPGGGLAPVIEMKAANISNIEFRDGVCQIC